MPVFPPAPIIATGFSAVLPIAGSDAAKEAGGETVQVLDNSDTVFISFLLDPSS
jgi:hypothetical protein